MNFWFWKEQHYGTVRNILFEPSITGQCKAHTTKSSGIVALLDSDIRMIIEADAACFKKTGDKHIIKGAELEEHKVK